MQISSSEKRGPLIYLSFLSAVGRILGVLFMIFVVGCAAKKETPPDGGTPPEAEDPQDTFIIGGRTVQRSEDLANAVASLVDIEKGTLCTASLLSNTLLLTAAHCVEGDPNALRVYFGLRFTPKAKIMEPVDKVFINPRWRVRGGGGKNTGDIAVVKFRGGIPSTYHPIPILKTNRALTDGQKVILAGYGINDGETHGGAGILRTVEIKIASAQFSETEVLLDQHDGKGACHGDSGGPAYVRFNGDLYLWGVTSRGSHDPNNTCDGDSIYTNILTYKKWLGSIVSQNN